MTSLSSEPSAAASPLENAAVAHLPFAYHVTHFDARRNDARTGNNQVSVLSTTKRLLVSQGPTCQLHLSNILLRNYGVNCVAGY
jgi:hypothetical protein